jgi:hypothetical protein
LRHRTLEAAASAQRAERAVSGDPVQPSALVDHPSKLLPRAERVVERVLE